MILPTTTSWLPIHVWTVIFLIASNVQVYKFVRPATSPLTIFWTLHQITQAISVLPALWLIVSSVLILRLVSFVMRPTTIFLVLWTIYVFCARSLIVQFVYPRQYVPSVMRITTILLILIRPHPTNAYHALFHIARYATTSPAANSVPQTNCTILTQLPRTSTKSASGAVYLTVSSAMI